MTSYFSLSSKGTKLTAAALACTALVGLSGCNNQSVLSESTTASSSTSKQNDPDRIHANHTEGADPDGGLGGFNSDKEYDDYRALIRKWGIKQTPDWLAICNQVNVPALRKVGFDPQKDLDNRHPGDEKLNCYWFKDSGRMQFLFGKTVALNELTADPKFHFQNTVQRNGETYYIGHLEYIGEGTRINRYECTLAFERGGIPYVASFTGKDRKTREEACNELIDMVSPQK